MQIFDVSDYNNDKLKQIPAAMLVEHSEGKVIVYEQGDELPDHLKPQHIEAARDSALEKIKQDKQDEISKLGTIKEIKEWLKKQVDEGWIM